MAERRALVDAYMSVLSYFSAEILAEILASYFSRRTLMDADYSRPSPSWRNGGR